MKPPVKNLPQRSDAHPDVRLSRQQTPEPRLPHEHDESADSQGQGAVPVDPVGQRAYDDAQAGRPDTDKGPVFNRLSGTAFRRTQFGIKKCPR